MQFNGSHKQTLANGVLIDCVRKSLGHWIFANATL